LEYVNTDIERIVQRVIQNVMSQQGLRTVEPTDSIVKSYNNTHSSIYKGVYANVEEAIDRAHNAYLVLSEKYNLKDRESFVNQIKKVVLENKEKLARLVHEETGIGRYEDKVKKHELAAMTVGTEDLKTYAKSGDYGLSVTEMGPFGLIGAITPVTNPTETIINNSISMIAAGNSVVFNVHPSSKNSCAVCVDMLNRAIVEAGGPEDLITMAKDPSLDTLEIIKTSDKVRLLVGTGGTAMVKALLASGKKAIGAGAGNPPVLVDNTADLEKAAKDIITGCSFDNNIVCILEKEVFVVQEAADELIYHMLQSGAVMIDRGQASQLVDIVLSKKSSGSGCGCSPYEETKYVVNKDWVGRNAEEYLKAIGLQADSQIKCIICDVDANHPFVQTELLMPILPIVRVKDVNEGIRESVKAEKGNRHTAIMHSKNVDNMTKFARAIDTTIFVKNAPSIASLGIEGEGKITFTIAGPTGEGLTTARTFTRQRMCVLSDGFRII